MGTFRSRQGRMSVVRWKTVSKREKRRIPPPHPPRSAQAGRKLLGGNGGAQEVDGDRRRSPLPRSSDLDQAVRRLYWKAEDGREVSTGGKDRELQVPVMIPAM
jgi:hypothetical protein